MSVNDAVELTELGLLKRAAPIVDLLAGRLPTSKELTELTSEFGRELAAAVLWRAVSQSEFHGAFSRSVRSTKLATLEQLRPLTSQFEITLIASNFMQSGRNWGDHVDEWRTWARALGFTTDDIATRSGASVSANARLISEHLRGSRQPKARIMLSYGQGTSELRYLFDRRLDRNLDRRLEHGGRERKGDAVSELSGIRGWISVCGSFAGSQLATELKRNFLLRAKTQLAMRMDGRNPLTLKESATDFPLWRRPSQVPTETMVASLFGIPYLTQVPIELRASYLRLSNIGPNDGVLLSADSIVHPGLAVPVPGLTHRAESVILEPMLKRLMLAIATMMAETNQSPERALELQDAREVIKDY
jgi:hypothetical protein